jgi:DNA-binding HxlR family transcriptional regulator
MILRAAFNEIRHFEDFLEELGIARNILSDRLGKLVGHGVLKREACPEDRRKIEYRLTEKGLDLLPAMLALRQWGEKYSMSELSDPVLVDARDRQPIGPIDIRAHDGRTISYHDLRWCPRNDVGRRADESEADCEC